MIKKHNGNSIFGITFKDIFYDFYSTYKGINIYINKNTKKRNSHKWATPQNNDENLYYSNTLQGIKNIINDKIKARLEYLRGEIRKERISYGELAELQSLSRYIEFGDVELLEWAGVPEGKRN